METGQRHPLRRRMLWAALAVVVLLGGGAAVVTQIVRARYAVPTADLFGSASPSVSAQASPSTSPSPSPGEGITGPLNILIAGADTRVSVPGWEPHADAVLILHVPAGLQRGYLFSLPRDLVVTVPAFPRAGFGGGQMKLTEAMSRGSRVTGRQRPDPTQGFRLFADTVGRYTGIRRFDAGAVLTFGGFDELVDALGGVDLYVDQRVLSQHRRPDGRHRAPNPGGEGYLGPQMVYEKGQRRLNGWQALDYARQRYLTGGDYTRQRHQRQLVKALLRAAASRGLTTDPARMDATLRALGKALVFDGRGRTAVDYGYALRDLRPEDITLVGLPGGSIIQGGVYRGEQLTPVGRQFLEELTAGRVEAFVAAHPELVDKR